MFDLTFSTQSPPLSVRTGLMISCITKKKDKRPVRIIKQSINLEFCQFVHFFIFMRTMNIGIRKLLLLCFIIKVTQISAIILNREILDGVVAWVSKDAVNCFDCTRCFSFTCLLENTQRTDALTIHRFIDHVGAWTNYSRKTSIDC